MPLFLFMGFYLLFIKNCNTIPDKSKKECYNEGRKCRKAQRWKTMKKLLSVLLATILLLGTVLLTGCNPFEPVPTKYDNADKYTAGNTEFEGTV